MKGHPLQAQLDMLEHILILSMSFESTFLIGHRCSLDYIEPRSRRKDDTRDLALWSWTADPSAIPKVKWLTLPMRGHRRKGRCRHRVIIRLDLLKDHSKAGDDDDKSPPPDVHEFTWYRKTIDGTFIPRDRQAAPGRVKRRQDRRDDDDDRDGRRGRDAGRTREGWGARVRRSLSRNARDRQREDEHGRTRDRRHSAASPGPVPAPIAGLLRGG
ncbi:hypothetical protein D1007_10919 [Hordeum vulgare]|nr:hypothetical protein D1007_10919 [Hordeum vulgare]